VPYASQDAFNLAMLERVNTYKGLGGFHTGFDSSGIFDVFAAFERKRDLMDAARLSLSIG
jgi:hypothetical protein